MARGVMVPVWVLGHTSMPPVFKSQQAVASLPHQTLTQLLGMGLEELIRNARQPKTTPSRCSTCRLLGCSAQPMS